MLWIWMSAYRMFWLFKFDFNFINQCWNVCLSVCPFVYMSIYISNTHTLRCKWRWRAQRWKGSMSMTLIILIVNPSHPPCFHSSVSVISMVGEWDICITSISTRFNLPPILPLFPSVCGVIFFRIFLINKLVVDDRDDGDDIHWHFYVADVSG